MPFRKAVGARSIALIGNSAIGDFRRYSRNQVKSTGRCREFDMLADPDEPRDPFGMLPSADPSKKPFADPIARRGESPSDPPAHRMQSPSGDRYSAWRKSA
ncbi:hypothetical protein GCM10007881_01080 [Mesorhizobium huakuii]|nr:hypothetical protein GCM10007881_01080 [Mesorhizobium huakuii]